MTLAAQIVVDSTAVFQNTDDFAESVTYFPRDGGQLIFPAVVEERIETRSDGNNVFDVPVLIVEIAADPTGLSGLPGPPRRGDALWRSGNGDPEGLRYAFLGRVLSFEGNMWELELGRLDLVQAGSVKGI